MNLHESDPLSPSSGSACLANYTFSAAQTILRLSKCPFLEAGGLLIRVWVGKDLPTSSDEVLRCDGERAI